MVSEHLQPDDLALVAESRVEEEDALSRCEPRWVERDITVQREVPKELVLGALRMVLPFALVRSARELWRVWISVTAKSMAVL